MATTQASNAVRRGPGMRLPATVRPTAAAAEPLVGGRTAHHRSDLRAAPRLQPANLVVGDRRMRSRYRLRRRISP